MFWKRALGCVRWFPVWAMVAAAAGLQAQSLSVEPVNIYLHGGEQATTLGITNQAATDTAVQIRAYLWTQQDGVDKLMPTTDLMVSPPIASIPAHATQIIRLVQRTSPGEKEVTYRILVDQIPAAAAPGIHLVLRLSIPLFAEPMVRINPHDTFRLLREGDKLTLIGANDGNRHDALHKVQLHGPDGLLLEPAHGASPYLLEGSTQHWLMTSGKLPETVKEVTLTAIGINGAMRATVPVVTTP